MTEIATQAPAQLPDLYRPAVTAEIDASDIKLPKLKIGQFGTPQVQEGLTKAGSLFTHLTREDADEIIENKGDGIPAAEGLEFYVLALRKGWSLTDDNDELQIWDDHDPARPQNAQRTYTYTVALPSVDEQMPFNLLLKSSSTPAAKQINLLLKKYEATGDVTQLAFSLGSKKRENTDKGHKWYVAQVTTAPEPSNAAERKAREAAQAVAANLAGLVQSPAAPAPSAADEGQPEL